MAVDRISRAQFAARLGTGVDAWPTPYWTVDASMAVMTLLHAADDAGLGALLFAVFNGADEVRAELAIPDHLQLLGAIALGWPADDAVAEQVRSQARRWVEENFDAHRNAARLLEAFEKVVAEKSA
jgi:nitroreductase